MPGDTTTSVYGAPLAHAHSATTGSVSLPAGRARQDRDVHTNGHWPAIVRSDPPWEPPLPPPELKHVWYLGPFGHQPALLLRWRQVDGRFEGLICAAEPVMQSAGAVGWQLTEIWVAAGTLTPAQA